MPQSKPSPSALRTEPAEFLALAPPIIPKLLDNVLLAFSDNIPEDATSQCQLVKDGSQYPEAADETTRLRHLVAFVSERLELISRLEYTQWLNGRLPFITPKELLLWRLRQYVEHIWAFQLPADEYLALIFNTTKTRAANVAADFTARFRKSLLFPVALRRIFRILRQEDARYTVVDNDYEYNKALGKTFNVPSRRYVNDTNSLIDEFRLREHGFLRTAALISKEDNVMWVGHRVIAIAKDDKIRADLLELYKVPSDSGYEG